MAGQQQHGAFHDDGYQPPTPPYKNVEELLHDIKPYGLFQRLLVTVICLIHIPSAFQQLITYFLQSEPRWRCVANSTTCLLNGTYTSHNTQRCELQRHEWEYVEDKEYSIVTYFDLNCETNWLIHFTSSSLYIGWIIGSFIISWAADRFGRKTTIFPCCFIIICLGFASSFLPNIYVFIVFRFLIGIFFPGNYHVLYVLVGEFVDHRHRPLAIISINILYSLAVCLMCLKAYFIRSWKHLLMVSTLPYIFVFVFIRFVPESLQWLHIHSQDERLHVIAERICYWNKIRVHPSTFRIKGERRRRKVNSSPTSMFRTCTIASQTLTLSYGWLSVAAVFYGLTLASGDLGGSMYLNFFLLTVIEIPAKILAIFLCGKFGRRKTTTIALIVASLAMFVITVMPLTDGFKVPRIILGIFGKACATVSYNGIFAWTIELYATDIRATAMGVLNAAARIGGAMAPWVAQSLSLVDSRYTFIVMGGLGLSSGCLHLWLPETRGKALRKFSMAPTHLGSMSMGHKRSREQRPSAYLNVVQQQQKQEEQQLNSSTVEQLNDEPYHVETWQDVNRETDSLSEFLRSKGEDCFENETERPSAEMVTEL